MENRSWDQFITHCLCHSFLLRVRTTHTLPLLQCCIPPMGNSPPILATSCSLSWIAPAWVLHGVTSPAANLLQRGLLSPRGYSSFQEPVPVPASHRVTASFWHPPAPVWVPHGLQVEIWPTMDLHGLQGHSLSYHSLHHVNLCPGAWSPPSALTLGSERFLLLHILTPLFSCSFCCTGLLFSFLTLNYVIPEAVADGLGQWQELAGIGSVSHRGSFWQLLTALCSSPFAILKSFHANPIKGNRTVYMNSIGIKVPWLVNTISNLSFKILCDFFIEDRTLHIWKTCNWFVYLNIWQKKPMLMSRSKWQTTCLHVGSGSFHFFPYFLSAIYLDCFKLPL